MSPPTTSALFARPEATEACACASAYMKPVQPAERSKAAASSAPIASATSAAVAGKIMSGVTVATVTRSISFGSMPASASGGRRRRQREIRHRLVLRRDPPLADAGAGADPLVGGVDEGREVVVRQHLLGHVAAEARDRDRAPAGARDHRSTLGCPIRHVPSPELGRARLIRRPPRRSGCLARRAGPRPRPAPSPCRPARAPLRPRR